MLSSKTCSVPAARARYLEDATPMTSVLNMTSTLKATAIQLAAGICASAVLATGALAGDMYNGSPGRMKDYGNAAVPVPAPQPYTEIYQYYLRGDLGLRVGGFSDYKEDGLKYGAEELLSPFGSNRFGSHANGSAMIPGTLGVGVFLSPRFRADATLDFRQKSGGEVDAGYSYTANKDSGIAAGGLPSGGTTTGLVVGATAADSSLVSGRTTERIDSRSTVMMVNGYYDLTERGRFTPYIGAGVGIAYNRIEREHSTTEDVYGAADPLTNLRAYAGTRYMSGASQEAKLTLAAAAMAGATVKIDNRLSLDLNYRLQYIQGYNTAIQLAPISAGGTTYTSRMTISDLWEHQLRAGVRVNLW
jgi:opacity protein-like surface antigen